MRRLLFGLLLLVGLVGTASAQLRLEASLNASRVETSAGSLSRKSDLNLGYRLGLAYEIKLLPVVYIAPGLQLRSSGSKDKDLSLDFKNTDLALPVMVGLHLPLGPVGVSAEVGPYASYTLKSSYGVSGVTGVLGEILDDFKDLSVSSERFRYGVGGSVALHFTKFYVRVGADYDLKNTYKSSEGLWGNVEEALKEVTSKTLKTRNMNMYIGIGVRL